MPLRRLPILAASLLLLAASPDAGGTLTTVALFGSAGAPGPLGGVTLDAGGNLYAALSVGSAGAVAMAPKSSAGGTARVLHSFTSAEGSALSGALAVDAAGAVYGVASAGMRGFGGVYKLTPPGYAATVAYAFTGGADGATPLGGPILDGAGAIYGTTSAGGLGYGTVFVLTPKSGGYAKTTLYSFKGGSDGAAPVGALLRDSLGNLFGATSKGGGSANPGTLFRLSRSGSGYVETVLHSFGAGGDGVTPQSALSLDANGNLYGTTLAGGANGRGTVFQATPPATSGAAWGWKVLYRFAGGADGAQPSGGVALDTAGNLYGVARSGGANGGGTAFRLARPAQAGGTWAFGTLYAFPALTYVDPPGNVPAGGLVRSGGLLFGATTAGASIWHTGAMFSLPTN